MLPGRETVVGGFLSGSLSSRGTSISRVSGTEAAALISDFVEGSDGEVYLLSKSDGMIRSMSSVPSPSRGGADNHRTPAERER